ncbi:amidase [Alicyclobacillus cellulosilyticus]|uniref:Amidase n=1 Tax=Alicyclobacillus cellulosilyticus TaxID=1003997 RepID=A0A917NKS8_9BACL|nr:amidase [Alicyclobacillus cellulosilyticus]GGJ08084.1 amidase [Alicyclobacillus cellulosilyticus]
MEPWAWSLVETLRRLAARDISAVELTSLYLERAQRLNPCLCAYITISDRALADAAEADRRRSQGGFVPPLAGVPIAIKDLFDTPYLDTTYGGIHVRHRPPREARAVRRLRRAGAVILGKTNLHEYAYGTTNDNPHFGACRNPWQKDRLSGGSSGGSAAAVAAGLCAGALGTDTGGSIRIPAALCGCVGFKPSYGRISTHGVFPLAPSLDHVGPLARSVADAAYLFAVLAGWDPNELHRLLLAHPTDLCLPRRKLVAGLPGGSLFAGGQAGVRHAFARALAQLEAAGWSFRPVDIPHASDIPVAQNIILASEARHVHRELLATAPERYGKDVRERLEAAQQFTGADYVWAKEVQAATIRALAAVWAQVDVLILPTVPVAAPARGQTQTELNGETVWVRSALTRWTNPWNLTGLPAVSLPAGWTEEGLPFGLQVVAGPRQDRLVLQAAAYAESVFGRMPVEPVTPDPQAKP